MQADGGIENSYTLKLANKTDRAQGYLVALQGQIGPPAPARPGQDRRAAGDVVSVLVTVTGDASAHGRQPIPLRVRAADGSASPPSKAASSDRRDGRDAGEILPVA